MPANQARLSPTAIRLRPVDPTDEAFLRRVHAGTLEREIALAGWEDDGQRTILEMQYTAQRRHYEQVFAGADFLVVEVDSQPVGRFSVDRSGPEWCLIEIALLPQHRNRGIGRVLVGQLQKQAEDARKAVRLSVEKLNTGSLRFFERLGFQITGDEGTHFRLVWSGREVDNTG